MPSENKQVLRLQQLDLMNKAPQSLMNDWSILIKKQFILIARIKMISNEEAGIYSLANLLQKKYIKT
tara:strand:- start:333 stop:533 length:201 start_codon:yes stop_codon:yes gene_type:complete